MLNSGWFHPSKSFPMFLITQCINYSNLKPFENNSVQLGCDLLNIRFSILIRLLEYWTSIISGFDLFHTVLLCCWYQIYTNLIYWIWENNHLFSIKKIHWIRITSFLKTFINCFYLGEWIVNLRLKFHRVMATFHV